jgi:O-antigen ligase
MIQGHTPTWQTRRWELVGSALIMVGVVGGVYWIGTEPVIRGVSHRFEQIEQSLSLSDGYTRPNLWKASLSMIADNKLVGVGLGAFPAAYPPYDHLNGLFETRKAHNDYLQFIAETGAVGAVLGILFLVSLVKLSRKGLMNPNPFLRAVSLGASVSLFGILVHSLVDFSLQVICNALIFLFVVSLIIVLSDHTGDEGTIEVQPQQAGE